MCSLVLEASADDTFVKATIFDLPKILYSYSVFNGKSLSLLSPQDNRLLDIVCICLLVILAKCVVCVKSKAGEPDVRVLWSQSWLVQGGPVLELVSTPFAACACSILSRPATKLDSRFSTLGAALPWVSWPFFSVASLISVCSQGAYLTDFP